MLLPLLGTANTLYPAYITRSYIFTECLLAPCSLIGCFPKDFPKRFDMHLALLKMHKETKLKRS